MTRTYKTPYHERKRHRRLRREAADLGLCINGKQHGKATKGVRCDACAETHKRSA